MNTLNLVQASAKVVRVTELTSGNVYKRLEESTYSEPELRYGVVYDVLHNGDDAVIQAVEYKKGYRDISVEMKTFATSKDLKIFNCTPDEVHEYLADVLENVEDNVRDKQSELDNAISTRDRVKEIIDGEFARKLSAPKTTGPAAKSKKLAA